MNIIIFIDRELNESYDFSSLKSLKNNFIEKIYFSGNKDLLKNISMLIQNKKNKYNLIFLVIKKVFLKEKKIEEVLHTYIESNNSKLIQLECDNDKNITSGPSMYANIAHIVIKGFELEVSEIIKKIISNIK